MIEALANLYRAAIGVMAVLCIVGLIYFGVSGGGAAVLVGSGLGALMALGLSAAIYQVIDRLDDLTGEVAALRRAHEETPRPRDG